MVPLVQSIDPRAALVGIVVGALLVTLLGLALRARRRRKRKSAAPIAEVAPLTVAEVAPVAKPVVVDGAALLVAVREAEAEGATQRLPGLYLDLAQGRLAEGETRAAADLLRTCIRVATAAGLKAQHAKARVALGDIAQDGGDPSTACEHWQIARLLFHELRQTGDYQDVDERMQRNKCPTDWVLTDF